MEVNRFLKMIKSGNGIYTFDDCLIRFCVSVTHPKYSVFNNRTREAVFFDNQKELLDYKIGDKTVKEHIRRYKLVYLTKICV